MSLYRTFIEMMVFFILALAAMTVPAMGGPLDIVSAGAEAMNNESVYPAEHIALSAIPTVTPGGLSFPGSTGLRVPAS